MSKTYGLDELFEEAAAQNRAHVEEWEAGGGIERTRAKAERERQARISAGWEDEEGNSLLPEEPEEDDEENEGGDE